MQKIPAWLNFPSLLLPTTQAADAQPNSPEGTCVTKLSRSFFARPCTSTDPNQLSLIIKFIGCVSAPSLQQNLLMMNFAKPPL